MSTDKEFGLSPEDLDMGKSGLGFRVRVPERVDLGVKPKTGLEEGPDRRRGIGTKVNMIGTALPRNKAEKIAKKENDQMGFPSNVIPWTKARVVGEKTQ